MKKLLCTLLAVAMLCSFMVVNASATEGLYEDPTDDMVSTYWETDTFYIDTDMELVKEEYDYDDGEIEYRFFPAEVNGEYMEDDAGVIEITKIESDDASEDYEQLVDMLNEWYEGNKDGDWDVYEINDTTLNGFDAVQFDAVLREGEFSGFARYIGVSDGENVYYIEIECEPVYEDVFNDLCDIVAEDLHFNNAPADDDKAEDKADKDDKDDKDTEDKKDAEEKDNSTVIIIVAVVAGVVVLGVVAIVVLGKKKKQ